MVPSLVELVMNSTDVRPKVDCSCLGGGTLGY